MNDVFLELKIYCCIVYLFLFLQIYFDKDRFKYIILNEFRSLEDKMKIFFSESVLFDFKF